jgi:hypothetical protein
VVRRTNPAKNGLQKQKTRWAVAPAGDENLVLANLLYTPHQARRCAVMMMVAMDSRIHLQEQNREVVQLCQQRIAEWRTLWKRFGREKQIPHCGRGDRPLAFGDERSFAVAAEAGATRCRRFLHLSQAMMYPIA